MATLPSIDLRLAERLKDREFRREWFRAQLEADVPELFRDLREQRKLTQSDVAEVAGMKQSAISRFEGSRDANWKFETLAKLADALDAQLIISLVPAENVIARYEREERGESVAKKSGIDLTPEPKTKPDFGALESANDVAHRSRRSQQSDRPDDGSKRGPLWS